MPPIGRTNKGVIELSLYSIFLNNLNVILFLKKLFFNCVVLCYRKKCKQIKYATNYVFVLLLFIFTITATFILKH